MSSEPNRLEQLANEGREHEQEMQAAIATQKSRLVRKQSRNDVLEEALGGNFGWMFWVGFVLGTPTVCITLGVVADLNATVMTIAWAVLLAGGSPLLYVLGDRLHRSAQRRWLASLPYDLDADKYLGSLGVKRRQRRIRVQVTLESPVPGEARKLVTEAMIAAVSRRGWMGDGSSSRAEFSGSELVIESGEMYGHFGTTTTDPKRPSRYSNRQFHRWFRLLADHGLSALHEQYPIKSVRVEI